MRYRHARVYKITCSVQYTLQNYTIVYTNMAVITTFRAEDEESTLAVDSTMLFNTKLSNRRMNELH